MTDAPRYLFLNRAPGLNWNQNRPASISDALFVEPLAAVATKGTSNLRLGLSFILSVLDGSEATLAQTLQGLLALSEKHDAPVLFVLDGQNWWNARPDLWNWWDETRPGYNPANRENVEWTGPGPDYAVKLCWRNWGRQIRVLPAPNLHAPRYRRAVTDAMTPFLRQIVAWKNTLPKTRRFLFPGVKVGWEASIGINAYHYPNGNELLNQPPESDPQTGLEKTRDFAGGLVPLGYAALSSAGRTHPGSVTLADHEFLTQNYLAFLSRLARGAGLKRNEVFTHVGGQYAPYHLHYTHRVAVNPDAIPGWSLYNTRPDEAGDLGQAVDAARTDGAWCAAEWLTNAKTADGWADDIRRTLGFRNCRSLSVYNWEGVRSRPEALRGLQTVLNQGV